MHCDRDVHFKETDPTKLFRFDVKGPREVYRFDMKLLDNLKVSVPYQTLKFQMTPYSTYIGLNEEILELTFLQQDKIVSASSPTLSLANRDTTIKIYDRTDAVRFHSI